MNEEETEYNLATYCKETDFATGGESFPEGKTKIVLNKAKVIPTVFVDDNTGKEKARWKICYEDKVYYAGKQVMNGIKEEQDKGAKTVIVIRKGEGLKTNYTVINAEE